jgi:hypothetical protein
VNEVNASEVLAAMITPALLISATGTLVLSTSHRLSRVVERVRVLARDAEQLRRPIDPDATDPGLAQSKRSLITSQLTSLAGRAMLLRSALAALYTAIGFLVATSIAVGALTTFRTGASWPVITLAMVGACALMWGSVLLVREGRLAIGSTLDEMQYVRGLVAQAPGGVPGSVSAPVPGARPGSEKRLG